MARKIIFLKMKILITTSLIIAAISIMSTSCRSNSPTPSTADSVAIIDSVKIVNPAEKPATFMPRAIIYKTDGDYINNVPVTMNDDRTQIVSYPAPTDITEQSTPIELTEGWLLDRRGISKNSVFTRYTYSEYSQLAEVPSLQQLMESILPQSRVTIILQLPMTTQEAAADTVKVNQIIREQKAERLYEIPKVTLETLTE